VATGNPTVPSFVRRGKPLVSQKRSECRPVASGIIPKKRTGSKLNGGTLEKQNQPRGVLLKIVKTITQGEKARQRIHARNVQME